MSGKTIVITGAGGVLCSTFAKALAGGENKIALLDLNLEAAKRVEKEITQAGCQAKAFQANVLDRESLEEAHTEILTTYGKCDILINGAGGNNPKGTTSHEQFDKKDMLNKDVGSFFGLSPEGIRFVMDLNYLGTLLPTQVFAKDMVETGGNIINISSMNAYRPLTKIPAYSAAKAAVSNLTQWLAVYFAKSDIRVNAIAPGFFVTNQNKNLLFHDDGSPTARTDKILRATPMGRFGQPEELIGTLKWLLDDAASGFVTGVVIPVDGGFSAYSGV